ncbi:MAG TPA: DUF5056 domain-containing protein [Opitutaceae bacterium]|nr:DUF5056 domain-containing protein [Opitutaceae bacterium]
MTPDSPEDARLEALLRGAAQPLADAGFSRHVLRALPPPRRKEKPWRAIAYLVAGAAVAIALFISLPPRDGTLIDLVHTLADPMFAGAVMATVFSLLVVFRAELRARLSL